MDFVELLRERRREAVEELRSRAATARVEFQAMLDEKGWTMADFEAWAEKTYPAE